ncbi:MAG: hypothetical protein GC129_02570 [Proteobacteria bacterium]|nr:hypothetical protein [Pseudomonadota bacterium]
MTALTIPRLTVAGVEVAVVLTDAALPADVRAEVLRQIKVKSPQTVFLSPVGRKRYALSFYDRKGAEASFYGCAALAAAACLAEQKGGRVFVDFVPDGVDYPVQAGACVRGRDCVLKRPVGGVKDLPESERRKAALKAGLPSLGIIKTHVTADDELVVWVESDHARRVFEADAELMRDFPYKALLVLSHNRQRQLAMSTAWEADGVANDAVARALAIAEWLKLRRWSPFGIESGGARVDLACEDGQVEALVNCDMWRLKPAKVEI